MFLVCIQWILLKLVGWHRSIDTEVNCINIVITSLSRTLLGILSKIAMYRIVPVWKLGLTAKYVGRFRAVATRGISLPYPIPPLFSTLVQ